ncbi:HAD-superfamily phosphatase [Dipodascopsis tothii]|uniref:HAD-superfamily phosphatase n=1 Tax=Dipodascopsis tothii TaxID=44089 RepID=UPI0034D003CB
MPSLNLSATLNAARLVARPKLCLPAYQVERFDQLPVPLTAESLRPFRGPGLAAARLDIRAIVVDKDNCFALPDGDDVYPAYKDTWAALRRHYPGDRMLIVSNSAGTDDDRGHAQAALLEERTGVRVLRHSTKKPGCQDEIMAFFRASPTAGVTSPAQVAVIGDRLLTDVMMANTMGACGVWISVGPVRLNSLPIRFERWLYGVLA